MEGYFFITDLVPGMQYTANFYSCAWETGIRSQTFANGILGPGADMMTINQDQFQNNNGIRVSYTYIAPTNGYIMLTQTPALVGSTFHTYGFANVETSVNPMPVVGLQPRSQVTTPGSSAIMSITAGGSRPLAFQWFKDGTLLSGQTTRFMGLTNISSANLGGYTVVVSNANGYATSQVANLTFGTIANPSFEADVCQTFPGYASLNTAISGWSVASLSRSGLNPVPSYPGPFANVGTVPDGSQVAFIQTSSFTNWLSTIMNGLTPGQLYTLSFRASARNGQLPVVHAAVDNQYILDFRLGAATNAYHYIAFDFTAATSNPTLYLTNDGAGDTSALFDSFSVAPSTTHWTAAQWSGDADSGVDPTRNYSHALAFNTTAGTTINGVAFTAAAGANPVGPGFVTSGFPSVYTGDSNNITSGGGGSAAMMRNFIYGGLPEVITLTNLVPGVQYEATIYSVGWADTNSRPYGRAATFSVGTDRQTFNQDHFGVDNGIKFTYRYTADASGTVALTYDATHNAPGPSTIHTYGFSNSELVSTNAPVFYQQPKSRTIAGGADVVFQVAVGGAQPIALQWQKNGAPLAGANGLTLDLGIVDGSFTGGYTCVASNAVGVVTSAVAQLEVGLSMINPSFEVDLFTSYPGYIGGTAPNFPITGWTASLPDQTGLNPANGSPFANSGVIPDGTQVAFIQADGGTLSQDISGMVVGRTYYLKYYENARTGYKSPNLSVTLGSTTVVPSHTVTPGAYVRYVSGPFLATTSTATLTFIKTAGPVAGDSTVLLDSVAVLELAPTPPTFLLQPQGFFVKQGEAQSLVALVQGSLPMSLQWQKNLVNLDGATNSTLDFPAIQLSDAGSYRLIATNQYASATSQVAVVQVGLPLTELFNSGVDQMGNLQQRGVVDTHYSMPYSADLLYPGPAAWTQLDQYPVSGGTAYFLNGPSSLWIAPRVNTLSYTGNAQGNYIFRTAFVLDSMDPTNSLIRGQWAMDNWGTDILLNGVSLGLTNYAGFAAFSAFTITNGFVAGSNTLDFVITNITAGPAAFRVEMYGVGQALPPTIPRIAGGPSDTLATETQDTSLTVLAIGSPTLYYQWYYENSPLPGATDRTLLLPSVTYGQAGHYSVVVTNDQGSAFSTNALLTVNRNPIANPDYVATGSNQPVAIPFASLLNNDYDPDGDPLFVQSADTNSAAAGTIVLGVTSLTYTPPAGFVGPDQFQYYIRDNRGGTATGVVNVTVGATNFLSIVTPPAYSAGLFTATFSGVPGYPYNVQYATNVTGPWFPLTNAVADPSGLFEIIDRTPTPAPATRFYRATYP